VIHVVCPPLEAGRVGTVPPCMGPRHSMPPGFQRAFHARNIREEDEVISFGLFEMTKDE
jgi:hypothetical protein